MSTNYKDNVEAQPPLKKPRNDRPFNVLFSSDSFSQLQELAYDAGISNGALIRRLVRLAFDMKFRNKPKCATGGNCLVPQLHFQGTKDE